MAKPVKAAKKTKTAKTAKAAQTPKVANGGNAAKAAKAGDTVQTAAAKSADAAPSPQEHAEKRKHPRVGFDFLVQVRSESLDEFRAVHAKNLSVGGMFIQTPSPKPVGAQVYFQFTVKDGGTLIEGLAKVVHAGPNGMGVEFVSVLEPSASIIRTLVEARLRG